MSVATLTRIAEDAYRLEGDLDFSSVVELARLPAALLATDQGSPRIDLSGIRHANSAGLALLVEWLGQARSQGCELRFTHLPASLRRLAELSNLDTLIDLDQGEGGLHGMASQGDDASPRPSA